MRISACWELSDGTIGVDAGANLDLAIQITLLQIAARRVRRSVLVELSSIQTLPLITAVGECAIFDTFAEQVKVLQSGLD
jgi:hypothetical protein